MDRGLCHCTGGKDQDHPQGEKKKKQKRKMAELLSNEALQIAEKRRETKGNGEKENSTHLNAEFQR